MTTPWNYLAELFSCPIQATFVLIQWLPHVTTWPNYLVAGSKLPSLLTATTPFGCLTLFLSCRIQATPDVGDYRCLWSPLIAVVHQYSRRGSLQITQQISGGQSTANDGVRSKPDNWLALIPTARSLMVLAKGRRTLIAHNWPLVLLQKGPRREINGAVLHLTARQSWNGRKTQISTRYYRQPVIAWWLSTCQWI